ncbi:MAG: OmpA family protein, partial [Candidatus Kapabacteria bacterium]|nr:OmpA family protein [Candidatus Kapabacteria bacterium]
ELPDEFGNTRVTQTSEMRNDIITRNKRDYVKEPTIYGGISTPVFSAPQNMYPPDSLYKTVTFMEGNSLNSLAGLPSLQIIFGLPTRTQLRFRFLPLPVQDATLTYFAFGINQRLDKFFHLFGKYNTDKALAVHGSYHSMTRGSGFEINSISAGVNFTNSFEFGLNLYSGLQFETMSGSINAIRVGEMGDELINSPYPEIRNRDPLVIDVASFTNFRATIGATYKLSFLELNANASYASQPMLGVGVTFWLNNPDDIAPLKVPEIELPELNQPSLITVFKPMQIKIPFRMLNMPIEMHFELKADVSAYGKIKIDAENYSQETPLEKIKIEEFLSRQMKPILPYLFFDDNSSEVAQRYILFNSPEDANNFDYTDLLGISSLESYYHFLNIIGKRLREFPNEGIKITGYRAGKGKEVGNKTLTKERADRIRDYFRDIWLVDESRINVVYGTTPKTASNEKTELGVEENRRVEIDASWNILAPIILNDTIRTITPDMLTFKTQIINEAPLKDWSFDVSGGVDKLISEKGGRNLTTAFDLLITDKINSLKNYNDLRYSLTISDSTEQIVKSETKRIPIELLTVEKKRQNETKDTIINIYNLILFDFDKHTLDPVNKRITDIIKSEITDNATVNVIGYTDVIGDDDYNLRLSTRRAESTAHALNAKNIKYLGLGESDLLFSNESPEGRFYCRTVVVEVKIPVN